MNKLLGLSLLFLAPSLACGQVFTDPEKAGEMWQTQGEYIGKIARNRKLGAEVVAKGKGNYMVNFLPGGLRGEGGDYSKRIEAKGQTTDEGVKVTGNKNKWMATIRDGKISGKTAEGESFTLEKNIRKSKTLGLEPPKGAVVLYRSPKDKENWNRAKIVDGNLVGEGNISNQKFKDHKIHLEFRLTFMPTRGGQGRSNSGVYPQRRYEVQVLDSFGLKGRNNECGGIYSRYEPKVNMCFPPLTWQTYDIEVKAARFDSSGKKTSNARFTVYHNGVKIHDDVEIKRGSTGGGRPESPEPGPLYLQGHGGQVQYRNIWVMELGKDS